MIQGASWVQGMCEGHSSWSIDMRLLASRPRARGKLLDGAYSRGEEFQSPLGLPGRITAPMLCRSSQILLTCNALQRPRSFGDDTSK